MSYIKVALLNPFFIHWQILSACKSLLSLSMEVEQFGGILLKITECSFNPRIDDKHLQIVALIDLRTGFLNLYAVKRGALLRKSSLKKELCRT